MKKIIIAVVVIVVIGLIYMFVVKGDSTDKAPVAGNEPAVTLGDSYKTASYTIEGTKIALGDKNGKAKFFGNEARGDLNGDGTEDVAFLITNQPGGSGTFYYVVAAMNADGGFVGTNAIFLGDRIAPQNTQIVDGDIVVNFADRKSGESMTTAPSVGVTSYFKYDGGSLNYSGSR